MQNIIFSGSSNTKLTQELANLLGWPLGQIEIKKFSDGETYINIIDTVKDKEVFVLQSCHYPCHQNLMEMLIILDALKGLSPKKITAILPFFAYRRQEKKTRAGESITARLVAGLLEQAGAQKVITVDIHTDKILNFFKIPAKNLEATGLFLNYFKNLASKNLIVMAPDRGAFKDAKRFAKKLGAKVSYIEKRRDKHHDKVQSMKLKSPVKNKDILIIDDEINTAGTLAKAVALLKSRGAKNIYAACTHAVFSGQAAKILSQAPIKEIIITNTVPIALKTKKLLDKKIKILSIAEVLKNGLK